MFPMKNVFGILALFLFAEISGTLSADEPKEGEGKPAAHTVAIPLQEVLNQLNLSEKQKADVKELMQEFGKKVKEVGGKMEAVLSDKQKQLRNETIKAAVDAGIKSREEIAKAVSDAIKLTDEQKTKMQELNKGIIASQREMVEKIKGLLTPDQAEQMKGLIEKRATAKARID
jgi:NAD-specific glutamate dehydrogenase